MTHDAGRNGTPGGPGSSPADVGLPVWYETDDLAARYRCDVRTIRDWIMHGCPTSSGRVKLPAVKLGRKWQVREDWLLLFEHRVRPPNGRPDLDVE